MKKKIKRPSGVSTVASVSSGGPVRRTDGWTSALGGQGTSRDKRLYHKFVPEVVNYAENMNMWMSDDLAGRIVEMIPNEMTRQGWELCVEGDHGQDIVKRVVKLLEDFDFTGKLWTGLCYERAYGGGGVVIGANDQQDFSQPLDVRQISSFNWLETFEPQELQAIRWQRDPMLAGFGKPDLYRLIPISPGGSTKYGVEIHVSRIGVMPGIQVSRRQVTQQSGWGTAALTRCRSTLRDFQTCWTSAGLLVQDFAQAVWKIKGLSEIIALDKDKELQARISAMELGRSTVRATIIDAEIEEFSRQQTPVSGLSDLLVQFASRLAAAADTPVTLLMGTSPAGMNATGESDIRTWYDRVKSMQVKKLKPIIEKMVKVAFGALGIPEPESWSIEFHPLWQPTAKEQADTQAVIAGVDEKYVTMTGYTAEEVRRWRFSGRKFNGSPIQVDPLVAVPAPVEQASTEPYKKLQRTVAAAGSSYRAAASRAR